MNRLMNQHQLLNKLVLAEKRLKEAKGARERAIEKVEFLYDEIRLIHHELAKLRGDE